MLIILMFNLLDELLNFILILIFIILILIFIIIIFIIFIIILILKIFLNLLFAINVPIIKFIIIKYLFSNFNLCFRFYYLHFYIH